MLETPAVPIPSPPTSSSGLALSSTVRSKPYPIGARSSLTLPSSIDSSYPLPSSSSPSSRTLADDATKGKSSGRRVSRAGVKGIKDFLRSLRLGGDMPEDGDDLGMGDGKRSVSDPFKREHEGTYGTISAASTAEEQSFSSTATRKSPRRPSLASIFRFGSGLNNEQRSRSSTRSLSGKAVGRNEQLDSDTDWDRMSIDDPPRPPHTNPVTGSTVDLSRAPRAATPSSYRSRADVPDHASEEKTVRSSKTVRRVSPQTQPPLPPMPPPPTLSNPLPLPMRSAPPGSGASPADWPSNGRGKGGEGREGVVELSPENLKPLLEHVKEVERRCGECLGEMRGLVR